MSAAACKEEECNLKARIRVPPRSPVEAQLRALSSPDIRRAIRQPGNEDLLYAAIEFEESIIKVFDHAESVCVTAGDALLERIRS